MSADVKSQCRIENHRLLNDCSDNIAGPRFTIEHVIESIHDVSLELVERSSFAFCDAGHQART